MRRRRSDLRSFRSGEYSRTFENHRRRHHQDLLQAGFARGTDSRVERSRRDSLVFSDQVVRILVEIGDTADLRSSRHQNVAINQQRFEQLDVFAIAASKLVARIIVVAPGYLAILREVVDSNNLVTSAQQILDQVAHDEARGSG